MIVVDFPGIPATSRWASSTLSFDRLLASHLSESGFAVVQTTSPLVARRKLWTVATTLESGRPAGASLPCPRSQLRRMGFIRPAPSPGQGPSSGPSGLQLPHFEALPALFQFPCRHEPCAHGGEPAFQPGAGARVPKRSGAVSHTERFPPGCRRYLQWGLALAAGPAGLSACQPHQRTVARTLAEVALQWRRQRRCGHCCASCQTGPAPCQALAPRAGGRQRRGGAGARPGICGRAASADVAVPRAGRSAQAQRPHRLGAALSVGAHYLLRCLTSATRFCRLLAALGLR